MKNIKIKKSVSFATIIKIGIVFIVFGLSSCNDEEPETDQEFVFNLDKYFTIDEGSLSLQQFLQPDTATVDEAPMVDSVYGESIIPDGGESQFNVILSEPTQSIIVGVASETFGYYQLFAPESGPTTEFSFDIDFANENFENVYYIQIAGIDEDGNIGNADSTKVIMVDAALGMLTVSCEWDTLVDMDLYLQEPNGDTIYFDNPVSANKGFLDMDSNPFCWLDSVNAENIVYNEHAAVEAGTYKVLLRYLSNCEIEVPVEFTITVELNDTLLSISGADNPFTGSYGPTETFINPVEILSFDVASDARKSTSLAKQRMLRFGYSNKEQKQPSLSPEKSEWEENRRNK